MDEPEIDAVPVRVESNWPYPPGMIESQEFREEGDVSYPAAVSEGCREKGSGYPRFSGRRNQRGRIKGDGSLFCWSTAYPVPLDSPP